MIYEAVVITEDGEEHSNIDEVMAFDMKYTFYVKITNVVGEVVALKPCNHQLHMMNTIKKLERDSSYVEETINIYGVESKWE